MKGIYMSKDRSITHKGRRLDGKPSLFFTLKGRLVPSPGDFFRKRRIKKELQTIRSTRKIVPRKKSSLLILQRWFKFSFYNPFHSNRPTSQTKKYLRRVDR